MRIIPISLFCLAVIVTACAPDADTETTNAEAQTTASTDTTAQHLAPDDEPQSDLTAHATGFRDIDPNDPPQGSPIARALTYVGDAYVHVVYSQPYLRGRQAFGEVVPYDEVWAAGAHFTTELLVTAPITVEGERLNAGVYSLFITPSEDRWTIHFNSELGGHMTGRYNTQNDVLTVDATPEEVDESIDPFIIQFQDDGDDRMMTFSWQNTRVSLQLAAES